MWPATAMWPSGVSATPFAAASEPRAVIVLPSVPNVVKVAGGREAGQRDVLAGDPGDDDLAVRLDGQRAGWITTASPFPTPPTGVDTRPSPPNVGSSPVGAGESLTGAAVVGTGAG